MACSIVGARLDYCNSVLYGAPTLCIQKLQRFQDSLARVVLHQPRMSHVICSPTSQVTSLVAGSSKNRVQSRSSDVQDTLYFSSGVPALAAVKPHQWIYGDNCGRLRDHCYTCHEPELSTAAAPLVSLSQLYGTVCLLTSLTVFRNCLKPFLFNQTFYGCPAD